MDLITEAEFMKKLSAALSLHEALFQLPWSRSRARRRGDPRGASGSLARLRRLESYMRHFGYKARPLDERLSPAGMEAFSKYHAADRRLRKAISRLLRDHGS